ncbi:MAG: hypothetical protein QMD46_11240 [Methanomicrobiales archaeon]|nr:hypothetical protein [Methanomicrobiales archaeon]MDI6876939.1 hypothetical protein [Methanomicrobiales archaeon]
MRTRTTLRRASRAPILRRMKRGACSPEETTQILEDQQPDHRLGLRGGQPAVLGEPGGCRGRAGIEERRTDDERLDRVEARRQRSRESDGHVDVEVEESADREAGSPGEEPRQPELRSGAEQQEDQARVRGEEALLGTGNAGVPDICPGQDGARHGGTGRCFERIARATLSIQVPSSWLSKFFSCSGSPMAATTSPSAKANDAEGPMTFSFLRGTATMVAPVCVRIGVLRWMLRRVCGGEAGPEIGKSREGDPGCFFFSLDDGAGEDAALPPRERSALSR